MTDKLDKWSDEVKQIKRELASEFRDFAKVPGQSGKIAGGMAVDAIARLARQIVRDELAPPDTASAAGGGETRRHCRTDCKRADGIICPDDSCDIADGVYIRQPAPAAEGGESVVIPKSDANDLDDVVRELGIEDSFTTPAEAVRELKELADGLEKHADAETIRADTATARIRELEGERDIARASLALKRKSFDTVLANADAAEASLAALRAELRAAEYQPGDWPVIPLKIAVFMDKARALLTDPATPTSKAEVPDTSAVVKALEAAAEVERLLTDLPHVDRNSPIHLRLREALASVRSPTDG